MSAQDSDVAARLIERLLVDPAFRATFRRDPAAACREAGLDALADEMALGAGKAMMTLDVRESKSSLAGVMMAAAMEGIGLYQFSEHVLPHIEDIPGQVGDVLSRVDLPSIRGALAGGGGPAAAADVADVAPAPGGGGAAAADAAQPAPPAAPPEAPPEQPAATAPPEAAASKAPAPEADAPVAPAELPEGDVTPHAVEDAGPAGAQAAAAQATPAAPTPGGSSLGAAALSIAQTQRGVHEIGGANTGAQVDQYLAAAGVPPGNPWCASFVTWSLAQAGHKMPGGGWGGVVTWVRNAEQGSNGLRIVSAEEARPGDIVAYDWGGQNDFGADGHIGFLQSTVEGGQFTALEGNNADAVNVVPRHLGGGPNIVFIRAEGNAPAGAAAAPAAAGQAPVAATASAAPAGPAAAPAAAVPAPGDAAQVADRESMTFKAVSAQAASKNRATMQFAAAKPSDAAAAAGPAPAAGAVPPEAAGVAASAFAGGPDTYPGDDAPKAQLAAWLANEASKRGLPPELPVMASLVESGVRNLRFGDADSVGFFQMRVGIWNQGAYAGFPDDPQKQIDWFLDNAEAVKKQRIAAGKSVTDPNQYGDWIADIERPAEQYRGRYALRLDEARGLLREAQPSAGAAPVAAAADVAASAPAPAAAHAPIDPAQFGAEGHGGAPDAEAAALLRNDNIVLDPNAVQDIKAGRIDPRVIAVLTKLSHDHKLTISCTCSDHPKFTTGGSISNHHYGRGVDIAAVDGVPVNSSNFDAREIAMELQGFDTSIRPDEIGSPWAISGPGYFTDAGHQDHLHVGFKQAIDPSWKPPAGVAATASAAPGAAAPAGVPPVAAPAAAPPTPGDSMAFNAVSPDHAAKAAAARAGTAKPRSGDSLAFQAVKAPAAPAAAPPAAAVPPEAAAGGPVAAVDAAAAAAGSGGAGPKALAAIAEAKKYLGTPYHWGGSTPQTGFDCSGLMQWAYAKAGIQIPRVTYTQIADPNATPVDRAHLQPGDLVFFSAGGDVHHVGMSLGGDKFLHAPHTGDVVKVSSLDEPYYKAQFAGGRRLDDSAPVAPAAAAAPAAAPAPVPAAAPAVDPLAVAKAQAAVARDAAEVRRNDSMLFKAVRAQESSKARATLQFMAAVDPKQQVKPAAAPPEAITPAPADAASAAARSGPAPDLSNVDLGDYPGDDASQEQLAKWLAKQAEKAGLPPELPVMASLVESGVRNLSHGDADSVGFFQMRVGIWDRGPYAGFPENPKLQVKWFIDNALNVRRQRLAAGKPIDDPGAYGEWIADIERPAAQYRYRYQLRLSEARRLLS